ncbi:hypothetical protein PR202_ga12873 [Eleusine coracana subsp. coracana]|uniref:Uncharacterized protein n=1 Tax=Eleusine coracana subsp. coracana TaxID=191504 RepID=A0AAV5CDD8_ELECO|nr:hypothetical protein PR202_ga12873 [Eleusine coracana subsp. coracana]
MTMNSRLLSIMVQIVIWSLNELKHKDWRGLGKTIQTIAFLSAVTEKGNDHEFSVAVYHGPNRDLVLERIETQGLEVADTRKKHLVSVLKKFLLRRTKEETIGHLMLGKEDNIIFCKMSDVQKRVYRRMLQQPDIQILINKDLPCSCGSPLTQISNHLELIKPNPKDDIEKQKKDAELAAAVIGSDIDLVDGCAKSENFMSLSDAEHCGKMRALEMLLSLWTQQGDKILLFSYSVRMLDILEKFLIRKGYCFSRFDGTTPMNARQLLVDEFNRSPSKQDDKKFKGELFGICNLFRDLSDKLFTSEIIEMHGDDGKSNTAEATGIREIVDTDLFSSHENEKASMAMTDTENQKWVDLGIVYAHRNEDVVNMRTNGRNDCAIDQMIQSSAEELENKHETTKLSVMAKSYSMEQKKEEFSRIASFMGMSDLEFSKWLLTASPQQRSEVLKNYKRKKNRKYHRNHK